MRDGKIAAASEAAARQLLRGRGETVVRIVPVAEEQPVAQRRRRSRRHSADDAAGSIRQLSILARAGVPLVESLRGLAEQASSESLSSAFSEMSQDVSQGAALSEAFAKHPHVLPTLAVEMARVAEAGGNLADSLGRLADHMESGAEITRKVRSALAYPIVVMFISAATVIVMVTFILPRFMKLFSQMGAKLPWSTRMLVTVSRTLTGHWYLFVGAGALAFYLFRRYARSPAGRRRLDGLSLKLPLVGDVVSKIVLNRVLASMSTLLASGVPMLQTLQTAAAAANNECVKEALLQASKDVAEGKATSQSLRATGMFPPLVLQMVASGEKTGELPSMLDYTCLMYSRETDAKVKSLTSIIEPVMIVVLGLIVGFIAMSVIVPIYSLVGGVK